MVVDVATPASTFPRPRRPAVFAGQFPLLAVTVLAVLVGVAFCLVVLLG
jgi:hypothetical protein